MTSTSSRLFILSMVVLLFSCHRADKKSSGAAPAATTNEGTNPKPVDFSTDSSLVPARSFIEKGLENWVRSFNDFSIDSFHLYQHSAFTGVDYREEATDLDKFYELYKPALVFSPDSSQFLDLYSAGLSLEKKGKKIIAIADVDQAVTLCNLRTKAWNGIAYFGASAWIEEAVWTSATTFILGGIIVDENSNQLAMILSGDTNKNSFRWYESKVTRPQSVKYEASGMKKLKIDEWE